MFVEEDDAGAEIPEWVVTFGDMMSLLLTFFIMLVSLSEIREEEKFQAMVESLRQQFGHDLSRMSVIPGNTRPRNSRMAKLATMGRARKLDLVRGGHKSPAPSGDNPPETQTTPGIPVTQGFNIFFEEGVTTLSDQQKEQIKIYAQGRQGKPQKIEVRGHTSMKPASKKGSFKDNWELGFLRARAVVEVLVQSDIDAKRIRVSSAGKYEPIYLNEGIVTAEEERTHRNARVSVLTLDEHAEESYGANKSFKARFDEE